MTRYLFSKCKMKKFFLIFCWLIMSHITFATSKTDSMQVYYDRIETIELEMQTIHRENGALKSKVSDFNSIIPAQTYEIDLLKLAIARTNNRVSALTDSLNINITTTKEQIQTNSDFLNASIAKKSQTGLWIFIVLALVVASISFFFGRLLAKRGNEVASLSAKADKLNEEIVNRLSSEMSEMQTLSKQIGSISTATGGGSDTEQKLITTLADRITFMEMTLYKMDSSVRGHKQLSKSIKQMKDNLLANGYELVDMLGKDYHDGMKVTANFVEDENLPDGKQIITGIIKPQINYQGKMIQSAQITVSQNL